MPVSFADPQTVTISGTTIPLPRTSVQGDETEYTSADGTVVLKAAHTRAKRIRRTVRIDLSKMAPDAFRPTENTKVSMSCYLVFDLPTAGYTPNEALAAWVGFKTQLAASSDLLITKLLAGES